MSVWGAPLWPIGLGLYRFARRHRKSAIGPHDAVVVFGARIFSGGRPSSALVARCAMATHLYQQGVAHLIVVSGQRHGETHSEASVGADLLKADGVPAEAILLEPTARNTWENARQAAALLAPFAVRRVVAVTDEYHLWRASRALASHGVEATPVAPKPRGRWWEQANVYSRESVSVVSAMLRTPQKG